MEFIILFLKYMMSASKYIGVIASYIGLCFLFIWGTFILIAKLTKSDDCGGFSAFGMFILIIITSFLAAKKLGWFREI